MLSPTTALHGDSLSAWHSPPMERQMRGDSWVISIYLYLLPWGQYSWMCLETTAFTQKLQPHGDSDFTFSLRKESKIATKISSKHWMPFLLFAYQGQDTSFVLHCLVALNCGIFFERVASVYFAFILLPATKPARNHIVFRSVRSDKLQAGKLKAT